MAAVDFIDWVVGIQASIAEEFKGRAVKCVATGFGDHVNHRSASMSQLGGITAGIHLEFLYRIFAELIGSAPRSSAADGLAEEGVVIVRAVDDEGIEGAALACKADVATAYVEGDAWGEEHEIDEVAAVCGEVFNGHIIHRGAHLTTCCFDDGGFIRDGNGLGLSSHREREVQVQSGADTHRDVLLHQLGETRVLDFDGVGTYREDGESKEAVGIASGLKVDAGRIVGTRQPGAGKSGTGLIDDDAFYGALIRLGPHGRRKEEKDKKECAATAQEGRSRFRNVHCNFSFRVQSKLLAFRSPRWRSAVEQRRRENQKPSNTCERAERLHQQYVVLS